MNDKKEPTLSDRLRQIRKLKGFDGLAEMAKVLEITTSLLSHYETGKRTPNIEVIQKYCTVIGVNLNWLIAGIGDPIISDQATCDKAWTETAEIVLEKLLEEEKRNKIIAACKNTAAQLVQLYNDFERIDKFEFAKLHGEAVSPLKSAIAVL